uniref:Uncharacterized protein n=1 Tax=Arundo donax TaxID=35708 RepID=A0A0A8ZW77_ARUDO
MDGHAKVAAASLIRISSFGIVLLRGRFLQRMITGLLVLHRLGV